MSSNVAVSTSPLLPLVNTICLLSGNFPGKLSQVFLPITIVPPLVTDLKCCKSVDCRHGKSPSLPMALFSSQAYIIIIISTTQIEIGAEICGW